MGGSAPRAMHEIDMRAGGSTPSRAGCGYGGRVPGQPVPAHMRHGDIRLPDQRPEQATNQGGEAAYPRLTSEQHAACTADTQPRLCQAAAARDQASRTGGAARRAPRRPQARDHRGSAPAITGGLRSGRHRRRAAQARIEPRRASPPLSIIAIMTLLQNAFALGDALSCRDGLTKRARKALETGLDHVMRILAPGGRDVKVGLQVFRQRAEDMPPRSRCRSAGLQVAHRPGTRLGRRGGVTRRDEARAASPPPSAGRQKP